MSNTYQIHVDTAIPTVSTSLTGYQGELPVIKQNGNPFDVRINLQVKHNNLRRVSLVSAEIPIAFNNVRAPYNTFKINDEAFTVSPGYYMTTSAMIAALSAAVPLSVGQFFVNEVFRFVPAIGTTATLHTTIDNGLPNLLSFLGFTEGQTGSSDILAPFLYQLSYDTYVSIYIPYLRGSSMEPAPITFKIPTRIPPEFKAGRHITYFAANTDFNQSVRVYERTQSFMSITAQVLDRFGQLLNNNNVDWSFSIEIESDT
jgi:hypothetical protein